MLTLIYRGIVALVLIVVGWNLFVPEKNADEKLSVKDTAALVLIPLVLRLLMIK